MWPYQGFVQLSEGLARYMEKSSSDKTCNSVCFVNRVTNILPKLQVSLENNTQDLLFLQLN